MRPSALPPRNFKGSGEPLKTRQNYEILGLVFLETVRRKLSKFVSVIEITKETKCSNFEPLLMIRLDTGMFQSGRK